MLLQSKWFESCLGDSNHLRNIWILRQGVIWIRNSRIRIVLSHFQPFASICEGIRIRNLNIRIALPCSSWVQIRGFESLCRWFKSVLQSLHLFFMRDSNHCIGDSNPWLSASLLLHQGFKSLEWWFESVHQGVPYWNWDSNLLRKDSNHFVNKQLFRPFLISWFKSVVHGFESQSSCKLTEIGIRISLIVIRITTFRFFNLHSLE